MKRTVDKIFDEIKARLESEKSAIVNATQIRLFLILAEFVEEKGLSKKEVSALRYLVSNYAEQYQ